MRFEIIFRGTLWQFVNEVRDLLENIIEDSGDVFFNHRAYEYRYKPGDPMTRVSFRNPDDQDAAKTGSIKATELPGEKTLLQIWAPDEHWEELKPYWKQLEDVMQRHGFIEGAKVEVKTPAKPGPKRNIRHDVIDNVALAIIFKKRGDFRTLRAAADRFGTTTTTVNDRRNNKDVLACITELSEDEGKLYRARQKVIAEVAERRKKEKHS